MQVLAGDYGIHAEQVNLNFKYFSKQIIIYFNISRYGSEPEVVEASEMDIMDKARHLKIQNLHPFFNGDLFKANNFSYDSKRKLVVLTTYVKKN